MEQARGDVVPYLCFFSFFMVASGWGLPLVSYLKPTLIGAHNWGSCMITALKKGGAVSRFGVSRRANHDPGSDISERLAWREEEIWVDGLHRARGRWCACGIHDEDEK